MALNSGNYFRNALSPADKDALKMVQRSKNARKVLDSLHEIQVLETAIETNLRNLDSEGIDLSDMRISLQSVNDCLNALKKHLETVEKTDRVELDEIEDHTEVKWKIWRGRTRTEQKASQHYIYYNQIKEKTKKNISDIEKLRKIISQLLGGIDHQLDNASAEKLLQVQNHEQAIQLWNKVKKELGEESEAQFKFLIIVEKVKEIEEATEQALNKIKNSLRGNEKKDIREAFNEHVRYLKSQCLTQYSLSYYDDFKFYLGEFIPLFIQKIKEAYSSQFFRNAADDKKRRFHAFILNETVTHVKPFENFWGSNETQTLRNHGGTMIDTFLQNKIRLINSGHIVATP